MKVAIIGSMSNAEEMKKFGECLKKYADSVIYPVPTEPDHPRINAHIDWLQKFRDVDIVIAYPKKYLYQPETADIIRTKYVFGESTLYEIAIASVLFSNVVIMVVTEHGSLAFLDPEDVLEWM